MQVTKEKRVVFNSVPDTLETFTALPEAALSDPFDTAALTVLAFSVFPKNRELCYSMINYLRGPRPLSPMEEQFIRDRFMDTDYIPRSYFEGATPDNDYTPAQPLSIKILENPNSYNTEGYAMMYINSSGADSPRNVQLRLAKDGKWYLWEQYVLVGIRQPESQNPWA